MSFSEDLAKELLTAAGSYTSRRDRMRFGTPETGWARVRFMMIDRAPVSNRVLVSADRFFDRVRPSRSSPGALAHTLEELPTFRRGWELLADEASREVYVRVLATRVYGSSRGRLPVAGDRYWTLYDRAFAWPENGMTRPGAIGLHTSVFDVSSVGVPLRVRMHQLSVLNTFLLDQYSLQRPGVRIAVEPGDTVIDGGAAWGDTCLLFALRAGPSGRVLAVECVEENLDVFRENLERNSSVKTVDLVQRALWDTSDQELFLSNNGPGSRVGTEGGIAATSITIDDLVEERGVDKVDFIKLDVEGSEFQALRGAERTLRRFRPKLAISVYHRPMDLALLPAYVSDLGLGYRCYLDHFTSHLEETVMFATADRP